MYWTIWLVYAFNHKPCVCYFKDIFSNEQMEQDRYCKYLDTNGCEPLTDIMCIGITALAPNSAETVNNNYLDIWVGDLRLAWQEKISCKLDTSKWEHNGKHWATCCLRCSNSFINKTSIVARRNIASCTGWMGAHIAKHDIAVRTLHAWTRCR